MTDSINPVAATGSGRRRPIGAVIALVAIGVFLAVVLFLVRNNQAADDIAIGTCFNVPATATIQTVEKQGCTDSHDAEVIHVAEYGESTYPISLTIDRFVSDSCVPAFQAYVGKALEDSGLTLGYFYPSRDSWDSGDRTVTCYAAREDGAKLTKSVKGSGS
jgi:hypothetical protein